MRTLVDYAEAAAAVGREEATIRDWVRAGRLGRAGKRGRRILVDLGEVYAVSTALSQHAPTHARIVSSEETIGLERRTG